MKCIAAIVLSNSLHGGVEAQTTQIGIDGKAGLNRPPAEGGVRRWQVAPGRELQLHDRPSAGTARVGVVTESTVLTNFGCSDFAAQTWCEVRSIRGGVRGFALAEDLLPAQGPDGIVARGLDDSRQRARRQEFDETDEIRCAQEQGHGLGRCSIGVARGEGGDATVAVTFANGFSRLLYFVHGEFVSSNPTMSGTGTDTDWSIEDSLHFIRVDDQRFEVPNAFVFGD